MYKLWISIAVLCACALMVSAQENMAPEETETIPQSQPQTEIQSDQQPEAERRFWKKHSHYYQVGYPGYGYQSAYPSYNYGYRYPSYSYGYGYRPYGYGYRPYGYGYYG